MLSTVVQKHRKQRLSGPQNIIHILQTFGGMKWGVNEVRFEAVYVKVLIIPYFDDSWSVMPSGNTPVELTKSLRVVTMRSISVDESIIVLLGLVMMFCILKLSKMVCSLVLYAVSLESL